MKQGKPLHFRFRCDAGARHGLGHLMRCLTVASELAKRGHTCSFAVNAPSNIVLGRIAGEGFPAQSVGLDAGKDVPELWCAENTDLIIVDSKDVDADYVGRCRVYAPVACFDDEIARHLPCDVIVNNHLWSAKSDYVLSESLLLLGPQYNTVGAGYYGIPDEGRCGVLISLGGEDPQNHTEWLIDTLAREMADIPVHVCIGPAHPSPESVLRACAKSLPGAIIYQAPSSLLEPISKCHIALSAGGTTCYELAAAGVAMVVVAVEEHQRRMQQSLVSRGAALSLGDGEKADTAAAVAVFRRLKMAETVGDLARKGRELFPAPGAGKVADCLIKVATRNECSLRND